MGAQFTGGIMCKRGKISHEDHPLNPMTNVTFIPVKHSQG